MGIIYLFVSETKPWIKVGQTVRCPLGRIEDYNAQHGTDFRPDTKQEWNVPDSLTLYVEQIVHAALEEEDFDRIRVGTASEVFTFAGRNPDYVRYLIEVTVRKVLSEVVREIDVCNRQFAAFRTPPMVFAQSPPSSDKPVTSIESPVAKYCEKCRAAISASTISNADLPAMAAYWRDNVCPRCNSPLRG